MAAITLRNAAKQFDGQVVLRNLSLELTPGQIVGLVGGNGSGKTTLLRVITGQLEPDDGEIEIARGLQIGYLPQEPQIHPENTLHQEVGGAFSALLDLEGRLHELSEAMAREAEGPRQRELMRRYDRLSARFEVEGGYNFTQRMNEVLGGLGFAAADHELPMAALSGGQKCRAALARLLLQNHTFLLLDEPTNHLDIDATAWLERFLASHEGGAVIVSHDRYLLDRVAQRIVELDRGRAHSYAGNYSRYVEARHLRRLTQQRQFEKDQAFITKEQAFIDQHIAGQRTKEAQGRRTRLERRLREGEFTQDKPQERRATTFGFETIDPRQLGQLRVEEISKRYGDKSLFEKLRFQVMPRERFAITGPNGTGKSTLLKIILGLVDADEGRVDLGLKSEPGYYAQDAAELEPHHTLLEDMRSVQPGLTEFSARSALAGFGFTGDDVFKTVGMLSGGEQSRLRLIRLIYSAPNLLILDEPTNHLDIASREALEDALLEFPGTLIAVSHDRYFIDRIAQRLLVMRPEGCRVIHGNYTDYDREEQARQAAQAREAVEAKRRRQPQRAAAPRAAKPPSPYDGMPADQLEALIMEREQHVAELNARFADPQVYRNARGLAELHAELDRVKRELAEAEDSWVQRDI